MDIQLFSVTSTLDEFHLDELISSNQNEQPPILRKSFTKKYFSDLKDISEVLHFFDSEIFKQELGNLDDTLLINIQVDGIVEKLRQSEVQKLSKNCKNKSIVIVIETKNNDKFCVYWKSKDIQNLLILSPYSDIPAVTDKDFYDFLANNLADSLANGHLGLNSYVCKSGEKGGNVELHLIADHRDFNLLMLAAECGKNKIVKLCLEQNLETEFLKHNLEVKSEDLAWNGHHYDVVLTLLKAGTQYPKLFDINECSDDLRKFCSTSEELHTAIKASNESKVLEILVETSDPHPFYNRSNESAAKVALVNKQVDMYKILTTHKVFLARHEVFHNFWGIYSEYEREMLRKIHFKSSIHTPEKHLNFLTNCSSVSHDDKNAKANLNLTQYAFGILNQISFIRIILMIVAASKKINNIIFDFKSTSVDVVDPTARSNTRGLFYTKGIICIAAGFLINQSTEAETFGTLAHELCHYAMFLVYRNLGRPYKRKDKDRRREFTKIAKICQENKDKEQLIDLVFDYSKNMQHAELIVRVPQLMALYHNQPEKLKVIRENFWELFDYYEKYVVPDMEKALPSIEKEIERMDQKILKNKIISILVGIVSIFVIIAGFFITKSIFYERFYEFDKLTDIEKITVENASVNYKNVNIQFQDLFSRNSPVYWNLTSKHISQMLNGQMLNFDDPHAFYLNDLVTHSWQNMTVKLQQKFLDSNFTFQKQSLAFKNLYEEIPDAFELLTSAQIIHVLDGKELVVSKMIHNETKFYVERVVRDDNIFEIYWAYRDYIENNFDDEGVNLYQSEEKFREFYENFIFQNFNDYERKINEIKNDDYFKYAHRNNLELIKPFIQQFKIFQKDYKEIIKQSLISKIFILSSETATGKTIFFEQLTIRIKEKVPVFWVSYINLKDFTKFYSQNESMKNISDFLAKILDLNSENLFERKIFEELYRKGKSVLLWDNFDAISPKHNDFVLNVFEKIHQHDKVVQFISMKPLLKKIFWDLFHITPHSLIPFDKEKQAEYLRKIFISNGIKETQNNLKKVNNLMSVLNQEVSDDNKRQEFNTPFLLKFIAESISDDESSENIYEIYEKFVQKRIDFWRNSSFHDSIIPTDSITVYQEFDIMRMFQTFALKTEVSNIDDHGVYQIEFRKMRLMHQTIPKVISFEKISQTGILFINDHENFQFAHKTFSEFFVAQFLIKNIYEAEDVNRDNVLIVFHLLFDITIEYGESQFVITKFMDHFLRQLDKRERGKFWTKTENFLKTRFKKIFFKFLTHKHFQTIEFLAEFFEKDISLLIDLLHVNEKETLYTASYNYAYFQNLDNNFDHAELKSMSYLYLNHREIKSFINGQNQKGIILFSLYLFYRTNGNRSIIHEDYDLDEDIFENQEKVFVFKSITKNLTNDEIKELLLSPSSPVTCTEFYLISHDDFWTIVEESLTKQEEKFLISNFFKSISRSNNFDSHLLTLINRTKTELSNSDIFDIFSTTNILHSTAAAGRHFLELEDDCKWNQFKVLWNFFCIYSNEDQRKEILLRQVDDSCSNDLVPNEMCYFYPRLNIFHMSLLFTSNDDDPEENFNYIKELYEQYFTKSQIRQMILETNSFLPYMLHESDKEVCKAFFSYLKQLFYGDENLLINYLSAEMYPTYLNIFRYMETSTNIYVRERVKLLQNLYDASVSKYYLNQNYSFN